MTKLIHFVLFVLACQLVNGRVAGSRTNSSKKYYLSAEKTNFFQAFLNCKSAGMNLAAAENEEESNALDAYLDAYKIEGYDNGFWLSGINLNNPTSKQYYWLLTGNPAIFTNWLPSEPDNYAGQQHCLAWNMFQNIIGWGDDNCEHLLKYVCEDGS